MRLLKNALLSSALALSMANADGAELNHAAMSLSEPAHGIVLSGGTSLHYQTMLHPMPVSTILIHH